MTMHGCRWERLEGKGKGKEGEFLDREALCERREGREKCEYGFRDMGRILGGSLRIVTIVKLVWVLILQPEICNQN